MVNKSVWESNKKEYPQLNKDIKRDIVVVGGGIAGFLTAFKLAEAGKKVTLVEADRLFSGTTGKTTAKITANQGNIYYELYKRYGYSVSEKYYNAQIDGMQGFADLIDKFNIDCDFICTDGNIFSRTTDKKLNKTRRLLNNFGADCETVESVSPVEAVCTLKMSNQYLFDPIKFLSALSVDFEIFENTRVVDIDAKNKILYCGNKIQASITGAYLPFTVKSVNNISNCSGKVVRYKGKKRAVYRDENGNIYAIGRKCPHLRGELKWNSETKTWDCPCHGSRFDIYGNIISEPSAKCCKLFKEEK